MSNNKTEEIRKDEVIRFRVNASRKALYKKQQGKRGFRKLAQYLVFLLENDLKTPQKGGENSPSKTIPQKA